MKEVVNISITKWEGQTPPPFQLKEEKKERGLHSLSHGEGEAQQDYKAIIWHGTDSERT